MPPALCPPAAAPTAREAAGVAPSLQQASDLDLLERQRVSAKGVHTQRQLQDLLPECRVLVGGRSAFLSRDPFRRGTLDFGLIRVRAKAEATTCL